MVSRDELALATAHFAEGKPPEEVATIYKVTRKTARRWWGKYLELMASLKKAKAR